MISVPTQPVLHTVQELGISPLEVMEKPSSQRIKDDNNFKIVTADKKG